MTSTRVPETGTPSDAAPATAHAEVPHTLTEQVPRTLGLLDQMGLWGNLGVSLLGFTGALVILQPGGAGTPRTPLGVAMLAVLVGTLVGTAAVAATAAIGARTGAPSMVLLRGLFGARPSWVPTVLNVVQMVGWGTFEIVTIASALGQVVDGVPRWVWVLACGAATTALALKPLGSVRLLRRYVSVLVVVALAYLTLQLLSGEQQSSGGGSGWDNFSVGVDTTIAVTVSWVPMAADYARHSRSVRAAAAGTFLGYAVMQVACYAVGLVALVSVATRGDDVFGAFLAVPLGLVAFLVITVRELDQSFANVYSTTISTQNLAPRWDRRAITLVVGALTTVLALVLHLEDYFTFLYWIGSVFLPLFAVLVVDWVLSDGARTWDLGERARTRWLMLAPWAAGFAAYHYLPPGPLVSASLVSFLVAALATAAVHAGARALGRRP